MLAHFCLARSYPVFVCSAHMNTYGIKFPYFQVEATPDSDHVCGSWEKHSDLKGDVGT